MPLSTSETTIVQRTVPAGRYQAVGKVNLTKVGPGAMKGWCRLKAGDVLDQSDVTLGENEFGVATLVAAFSTPSPVAVSLACKSDTATGGQAVTTTVLATSVDSIG